MRRAVGLGTLPSPYGTVLVNAFIIFLLKQFFETIHARARGSRRNRRLRCAPDPAVRGRAALGAGAGRLCLLRLHRVVEQLSVPTDDDELGIDADRHCRPVVFKSESGTNWPLLMSAGTLIAIPAILAFLLIERHLKHTMALSGIRLRTRTTR